MRSEFETSGTLAFDSAGQRISPALSVEHSIRRGRVTKLADYATLMKPELTLLSVITALGGFYLGAAESFSITKFIHVFLGTLFVGGGVGALNQFIEREHDALMRRTENRPLPSGRVLPIEALVFGALLSVVGIIELTLFTNALTGALAVITLTTYLFLYTPLKRLTWYSTVVGGIPGALPPMMGYAAARGEITIEAWVLFGVLFFWQMPHFFSLAWMYRRDYERAGYPMLTVLDREGRRTAAHILLYCIGLIPMSLLLIEHSGLGWVYLAGAVLAGSGFLYYAVALFREKSNSAARRLFFVSLLYLPVLLAFIVIDKL
jgi:protoheme IX farnesyltransferase